MTTQTVILTGPAQRVEAITQVASAPDGAVVTIQEAGEARTKAQNRLVHRWFADIAAATGDETPAEVKAHCNLTYGVPILSRDDLEWSAAFGYIFDKLGHAAKLKAIRVLDVPVTRRMSVKQLTEYMDQMRRDYADVGVTLTDPDAREYEGEI